MKPLFYAGLILLTVFEILNVYLIMPLPGSQKMDTVDIAYFLHTYRWLFRGCFLLMIAFGTPAAFRGRVWIPVISTLPVILIVYMLNFRMTADHMFLQPEKLAFRTRSDNTLSDSSLVIAVADGHEAKAYPIRFIQYHHQVRDTLAGKHVMVTYCNVCRTGRVFEPVVDGKPERFRLVGMDHFNAMFEDETTRSWWRQATGEAITGPQKGKALTEIPSSQYTLGKFFLLHPFGKVMDADHRAMDRYDTLARFEKGKSQSDLTRTDTASWKDKSWVVGVLTDRHAKAYDWNALKSTRVIHDRIGSTPVVIALASDDQSFIALARGPEEKFLIRNDTLISATRKVNFAGRDNNGSSSDVVRSYQEFWHSWKQFHPNTEVYGLSAESINAD